MSTALICSSLNTYYESDTKLKRRYPPHIESIKKKFDTTGSHRRSHWTDRQPAKSPCTPPPCSCQVHDFATLLGYGVDGVCPYLAYETLAKLNFEGVVTANTNQFLSDEELFYSYRKAAAKGILKVGSQVGTLASPVAA